MVWEGECRFSKLEVFMWNIVDVLFSVDSRLEMLVSIVEIRIKVLYCDVFIVVDFIK